MNLLDRAISVVAPQWCLNRTESRIKLLHARATMKQITDLMGGPSGYKAGQLSRLNGHKSDLNENSIPRGQIRNLRATSWDLYRNNASARKIVRQIVAKLVGKELRPNSLAKLENGEPFVEFSRRVTELWPLFANCADLRGKPGRGGRSFTDMVRLGVVHMVLSGECLMRKVPIDKPAQAKRGLDIPLLLQLVDASRLDENEGQHGITFVGAQRTAYHILKGSPRDSSSLETESVRVDAQEILHLYVEDDVDQLRGVPWFGPALMDLRDVGDYKFTELQAAAAQACVVWSWDGGAGGNMLGLQESASGTLTDSDGNPITNVQPGMVTHGGELTMHSPSRGNSETNEFIDSYNRTIAGAFPGVKGSSITGDFRGSSFASEKSADNDVWPEAEAMQSMLYASFVQPVYEEFLSAAVVAGLFGDVPGFTELDFNTRRRELSQAQWSGPVPRSINPKDDVAAARMRIHMGLSSVQKEAAAIGTNMMENLQDAKELLDQADQLGLPEEFGKQALGIQPEMEALDAPEKAEIPEAA